jgi:hypothetical protein
VPVNSQSTTAPASASITLSTPKPMSAIELAAIPAATAIPNSTRCHAIPPQASRRARHSRRARPTASVAGCATGIVNGRELI